ncbi:MAG: PSD1 and planctomycete cytochrome C domain-containing protein [Luteolibacter sp.]
MLLLPVGSPQVKAEEGAKALKPEELEFFENKIRPVLAESCYECHNSIDKKKGGLALDWKDALDEAGIIVPGKPEDSGLIGAMDHWPGYEAMPDKAPKLSPVVIQQFETWIRMGAPDPRTKKPTRADLEAQVDWPSIRDRRARWWSFQPLKKSIPAPSEGTEWNQNAIDRYIYAGIRTKGLMPQPQADPATLVRRAHLILTGLLPSPEVVDAFVADPTDAAYVSLVDRLIASPQFGEHWARHWMDWYRYAETHGSEGDPPIPYAGVYRDYLVRALNADVPYDQLIREQLAGDLLPEPRLNPDLQINESIIGPAQLRMVPHGFGVTNAYEEQITWTDNQIDVVSKAMLGLTVSCARCHNHKFDPISQHDFYRLYGVMVSSRPTVRNMETPERQEMNREAIHDSKQAIRVALADHWLSDLDGAMQRMRDVRIGEPEKTPDHDPFSAWIKGSTLGPKPLAKLLGNQVEAHRKRMVHNRQARQEATFHLDFRDPEHADRWFSIGNGTKEAVSRPGAFAVAPEGEFAITGIYPAGLYSHMISDKHSGVLNTVLHEAKGKYNAIRAVGNGGHARFSVRNYPLPHGLLHPSQTLKQDLGWVQLGKYAYWNGEKGYHEITTSSDRNSEVKEERSWFGVIEIMAGDHLPQETGAPLVAWHDDLDGIRTNDDLLRAYRDELQQAIAAWKIDQLNDEQAILLNAALRRGFLAHKVSNLPAPLRRLVEAHRELDSGIPLQRRVAGVMDAQIWDQPNLTRGDPRKEEEPVPRRFLEIFEGEEYPADASGRLQLAEDILRDDNPLASRVIVNRLWHHIFGSGLVTSTDNFGLLGEKPTHPELLDHLALSLRESGWSLKQSIRAMVLSRAFRSASTSSEKTAGIDPLNRWLSFYPPRRMQAESIHDALHLVADTKVTNRVMHQQVLRNSLNPFLTTFNFPVPTTTVGKRDQTNVPGQALTLLNGPIARSCSNRWAIRIKDDYRLKTDRERITRMYREAYSRPPTESELQSCLDFLAGGDADRATVGDPWQRLAHALYNTKEFIYVR